MLLLICGAPRSTTTAFHNALIRAGIFSGVIADDTTSDGPAGLRTDEYFPTIELPLGWQAQWPWHPGSLSKLRRVLDELKARFPSPHGLMLKAPHYVFGLRAFDKLAGQDLRVLYLRRHPFSVAASMTRHVHVGPQLAGPIRACLDFSELRLHVKHASPAVLKLASDSWGDLSPFERGLFVWHVYDRAFVTSFGADRRGMTINVESSLTDHLYQLSSLISVPIDDLRHLVEHYRPAVGCPDASLSPAGHLLWNEISSA